MVSAGVQTFWREKRKLKVMLTTLCENTVAKPGLMAEWGLSILVQVNDFKVLLDTGTSSVVTHNARILGIDLSQINKIVLSHGHNDHTGGLANVLQITGDKDVIAHPAIWDSKYSKRPYQDKEVYIGFRYTSEYLESLGASFTYSQKPVKITNEIVTTGEVEMTTSFEAIESNLFVKDKGVLQPDAFTDDLSLVINTPEGLIIILGCAHRGMINHIQHAQKITNERRVYAVVGGTHLTRASEERIKKTILELKKLDVKKVGVSHCTGANASMQFAQAFGDSFFLNNSGTQCKLL